MSIRRAMPADTDVLRALMAGSNGYERPAPREMIVAGAREAHCHIAWASHRQSVRCGAAKSHLHDAFNHARHCSRGQPVIAMAALPRSQSGMSFRFHACAPAIPRVRSTLVS